MRWVRPFGRFVGHCVLWIGFPLGLAQTLASPVMAYGLFGFEAVHKLSHPMLAYAFSYYLWNYPHDLKVQRFGAYGGMAGAAVAFVFMIPLAVAFFSRRQRVISQGSRQGDAPEPDRAWSNVHGSARWMRVAEAAKLYRKPGHLGGIPIVELNRVDLDRTVRGIAFEPDDSETWGSGGKKGLVIDPMRRGKLSNGVIIGPPGSGKSAGFSVNALYHYRGSMVVNDPSGEMSQVTAAWREEGMGHRVAIIDPAFPALGAFNILKTIDIKDPMCIMAIKALVADASGPAKPDATKEESFFKTKGLALNACLLADLLFDPTAQHTVREWRKRIVLPEDQMKAELMRIYGQSRSQYAVDISGELMRTFHETLSGVRSHATGDTEWLSIEPLADLMSNDSWDPMDLRTGNRTVYLQFPSDMMEADPSAARVILGCLMRSAMAAKGRFPGNIPFIIDEAYQFKFMRTLAILRDEGRKSGIPIYTMWQSEGQIDEVWGASGKKAWFNSAAWRMYMGGVDDPVTSKELSGAIGTYTAIAPTEGTSRSAPGGLAAGKSTRGTNAGTQLQARALISDSELRTSVRQDECIVLWKQHHAARFGIPYWQRRADTLRDLKPNPFLLNEETDA